MKLEIFVNIITFSLKFPINVSKCYSLATKNRRESNNVQHHSKNLFIIVEIADQRIILKHLTLSKPKLRVKFETTISIKFQRTNTSHNGNWKERRKEKSSKLITLARNKVRPSTLLENSLQASSSAISKARQTPSPTLIGAKSFLTTDRFRSVQVRTKRKWKLEADLSLVWHDILTGTIHRERSGIRGSFVPFVRPYVV